MSEKTTSRPVEPDQTPSTPASSEPARDTGSEPTAVWRLASIGTHFLVCMLIGYFTGNWIDGKFDTKPLWGGILGFLGIVAGFVNLFRELAIVNRAEEAWQREQEAKIAGEPAKKPHNGDPS